MRAVAFTSFGAPDVLSVVDLPVPEPAEGQVRVKVAAAPINPVDLSARSGAFGPMLAPGRYVLGWDVAGTVDAVGAGVADLAPGDAVIGMSDWLATKVGTHAEFVVLPAASLARPPATASMVEASTLPVNGLTAAQALGQLGLTAGQTLVIVGAGGAVGGYAAELATHQGVRVVAVSDAKDDEFLRRIGAVHVVRDADPVAGLRTTLPDGADALLDAAGLGAPLLAVVRDGGAFVSLVRPATPAAERGIRVIPSLLHSDGAGLRDLVSLVEQGQLTLRVAATFPFDDAAKAHAAAATGGTRGRVVLVP